MKFRTRFLVFPALFLPICLFVACTISSEKDPAIVSLNKRLAALEKERKASKESIDDLYFQLDTLSLDVSALKTGMKTQGGSPEMNQKLTAAVQRVEDLDKELRRLAGETNARKQDGEKTRASSKTAPATAQAAAPPSSRPASRGTAAPSQAKAEATATRRGVSASRRSSGGASAASSGPKGFYYKVQRGDTLAGVAKAHNVSSANLCRTNRMPLSAVLYSGQLIYVPRS
ncbi:MAG TPA: LysM peptidoglycan-binding domain-containing protein [Sumerlaeia bacterium]|nr:LysM peptidoglycan-binding domain-containing protein [Sumerlaeia bacterium]